MSYTIVAPVGDNIDALYSGMKEFATERVYLLSPKSNLRKAKRIQKKLQSFSIETQILDLEGSMMESMFAHFGMICNNHDHEDIIVNVGTGDKVTACTALSAAFANGLKAFGMVEGKPMLLPIMKLSYYHQLTESKTAILKGLKKDNYSSLNELHKRTGMSISLLSYHLNGTLKHKGLIHLRLVEVKQQQKQLYIRLSELGSLLLKGYITCEKT